MVHLLLRTRKNIAAPNATVATPASESAHANLCDEVILSDPDI